MSYLTRVAPGLIVSTMPDGDRAQTVTFATDPEHRSGANVTHVEYGPLSRMKAQHRETVIVESLFADALADLATAASR